MECIFCKRVVVTINDWLAKYTANGARRLDVSRTHVDVSLETDWHPVDRENHTASCADKAYSDRLRINCSIPYLIGDIDGRDSQVLTFFFQKYGHHQAWATHDAERGDDLHLPSNVEEEPYSGRKRPLEADLGLFKNWKQLCQRSHGAKCSQIFKSSAKVRPRVIDVKNRCLTFAEKGDQWVCLSYVWGKIESLQLRTSNARDFSVPGSLGEDVLPNIVEDALKVTAGLGEAYLWVDCLCIIQDDEEDKAVYISQMDSIYTLATVVIIAATCVDANSLLPGVRPFSRQKEPEPFKIRGATLVQSLDPVLGVNIDLRTGRSARYLGDTVWDTRAWTLQERFLAARSLVFTSEQVFWECEEAFWCEDSFRELVHISPDPHRTSLCGGELNLSWNNDVVTFDHFYRVLLAEYSGRSLTFDRDGLNAFRGIIRALESSMGERFFWGMPTAFLESALAWGHQDHTLRRRRGIQVIYNYSTADNEDEFPSWSWVGWTSDGQTKLANQNLITEGLGLRFFSLSDDGQTTTEFKQATQVNGDVDLLVEGSDLLDRSTRSSSVSVEDVCIHGCGGNLSSVLVFWSVSTRVIIQTVVSLDSSDSVDYDMSPLEVAFSQGPNNTIQVSWSQLPPSLKQGDNVEIVAIAQNRGDWDDKHIENGAIGVMLLSRGIGRTTAMREGFAWVAIRDWTAMRDREWKLILLQ